MRKLYGFIFFLLPSIVFAQTTNCTGIICNPLGESWQDVNTLQDFLKILLDFMVELMIPVIAFFVIYAGYTFATSGGDSAKMTKAKDMLLYIIIGALLLLSAKGISLVLGGTVASLANPQ